MSNIRGLQIALLAAAALWVGGMLLLSRATGPGPALANKDLPVYPYAQGVRRESAPTVGFKSVHFRVREKYPSLEVLRWYSDALGPRWRRLGQASPAWSVAGQAPNRDALLVAGWQDESGLWQLELRIWWQESKPGSEVWLGLSRGVHPASEPARPVSRPDWR